MYVSSRSLNFKVGLFHFVDLINTHLASIVL